MTTRKPKAKTKVKAETKPSPEPNGKGEPVSLYYAKAFDGEWYLLNALASNQCRTNLRTSGWALLSEHPVPPMEAAKEKVWTYAVFIGKFYAVKDYRSWEGSYEGVWTEWKGR